MSDRDKAKRLPRSKRVAPDARPPMRLMERDIAILQAVNDCRALRGEHIQALFFGSRSTSQYRLSRLFQHEYLNRHFLPVVEGGPASSPIVYTLGKRGAQALVEHLDYDEQALRVSKQSTFAWRFMEHLLAINDVRVAILLALRQQGWTLETWEDEYSFRADPDHAHLQDSRGRTRKKPVLPDGYFRLAVPQGRAHFFLEVDRGTELLAQVKSQVEVYQAYTASGRYYERFQTRSLRVLVVTTGARRVANLKRVVAKAGGDRKYWFTTLDRVTPETVLTEPIWQRLDDKEPLPLIGTPD